MDRPASKRISTSPSSPEATLKTGPQPEPAKSSAPSAAQGEVFDGLLLALLARKRLLVLVGEAGSGRSSVYRRLVEHVAADGALVLPVAAEPGMEVDDLIRAAGDAALPADDGEERDFDTLVEALEDRMELAGTGLLAVENAGLLAPPVLSDLIELTRSETQAGRFLQVLLCGTPDLERALARPGLAEAVRDLGVVYRTSPGSAPSVIPGAGTDGNVMPGMAAAPVRPAPMRPDPIRQVEAAPPPKKPAPVLAAPAPAPPEPPRAPAAGGPANDWDGDFDWSAGEGAYMAAPPRRRGLLYAGAAATTLILLAGVGAAVVTSVPGIVPERIRTAVESGWDGTRSFVERTVADLTGERSESEALALAAAHAVPTPPPAPPSASAPVAPSNGTPQPSSQQPPSQPAAPATAQPVAVAPLPPPATIPAPPSVLAPPAQPPQQARQAQAPTEPPPPQPPATQNMEAAPGSAALPPLEEAPPAPTGIAATQPTGDNDPGLQQRVRALVDQARRQMAGKRLTTPPGDNAFETVQRLRQIAPGAPEATELLAAMEETYRRWAAAAERDGDVAEARRFYERALIVTPDSADLRQRAETTTRPAAPEAEPGLTSRDSVLALLRRPAELNRLLQSGTSPDTRLGNGKTLLMIAAEEGMADAVKLLLERRARTDLRTADGATAVMYASWSGHEGSIAALADAGAELDATNTDGKTALMAAAARGHAGAVQLLIQRGVMVDRTTANGWSALMYAANNGHDRVAKLLVDAGANPYRMDTNGNSALTLGALQGHVQVVEALKPR